MVSCKDYANELLRLATERPIKRKLLVVSSNPDDAAQQYLHGLMNACSIADVQLDWTDVPVRALANTIHRGNYDEAVGGIILLAPVRGANEADLRRDIQPDKDLEGLSGCIFKPVTADSIMLVLHGIAELYKPQYRTALVIGRGHLVGRPIAEMLVDDNYTVTIAHSHTHPESLLKLIYPFADAPIVIVDASGKHLVAQDTLSNRTKVVIDAASGSIMTNDNGVRSVQYGLGSVTCANIIYRLHLMEEKQHECENV